MHYITRCLMLMMGASIIMHGAEQRLEDLNDALAVSVIVNDVDGAAYALAHGASVDDMVDDRQPLHWALPSLNQEMIALLIERKANVNARPPKPDSRTPLHVLVDLSPMLYPQNKVCAVIKQLLDAGADTGCKSSGRTPLGRALDLQKYGYRDAAVGKLLKEYLPYRIHKNSLINAGDFYPLHIYHCIASD